MTKKELKNELKTIGVEFPDDATKADLQSLFKGAKEVAPEQDEEAIPEKPARKQVSLVECMQQHVTGKYKEI